ncbi:MAG: hypothetical protein K2Q20_03690, partial [Phycisphaerales bacterium]|nr:hypothetical protein [Phycisphaerales bacterium]
PLCASCGFNLTGLPDGPCPECGTPFVLDSVRVAWSARQRRRRHRFRPLLPVALLSITALAALMTHSGERQGVMLWPLACLAAIGVWYHSRRSD